MESLDDSENAKISDSAYSLSCSNSQSRRSRSSKSTHSGSHSSGSSGYGGQPSTSARKDDPGKLPEKRSKDNKLQKEESSQIENLIAEFSAGNEGSQLQQESKQEDIKLEKQDDLALTEFDNAVASTSSLLVPEDMVIFTSDDNTAKETEQQTALVQHDYWKPLISEEFANLECEGGFSCVIEMQNGVVIYVTLGITKLLGYPQEMWIGRSFIDFVHPKDRSTFASGIMNGATIQKNQSDVSVAPEHFLNCEPVSMCARIRTYRKLNTGFGTKRNDVLYMPFLLNLSLKKSIINYQENVINLIIQATAFTSAFRTTNEKVKGPNQFVTRHGVNGKISYVDPKSVPYLGYLPQDLIEKDVLQLYHPGDLGYLMRIYEEVMKERTVSTPKAYRFMAQNGDYIKLHSEFSCFINPWTKKLEFVTGKHSVVQGPRNPDVFQLSNYHAKLSRIPDALKHKFQGLRNNIIQVLHDAKSKTVEMVKQSVTKRCLELASAMECSVEEVPKSPEELKIDIPQHDYSYNERESMMLGGISPHHESNNICSAETLLNYNQLNYNETLQRYFDNYVPCKIDEFEGNKPEIPFAKTAVNSSSAPDQNGDISDDAMFRNMDNNYERLSETLLSKHNTEMERELLKKHIELLPSNKECRDRKTKEKRQSNKDHLARCNAPFQPTNALVSANLDQVQSLKRPSQQCDSDVTAHKHHCTWTSKMRQGTSTNNEAAQTLHFHDSNTTVGMIPMYFVPSASPMEGNFPNHNASTSQFRAPANVHESYPQVVFGAPLMNSAFSTNNSSSGVQAWLDANSAAEAVEAIRSSPLGLTNSNFEEVCNPSLSLRLSQLESVSKEKDQNTLSSQYDPSLGEGVSICTSTITLNQVSGDQSSIPHEDRHFPMDNSDVKQFESKILKGNKVIITRRDKGSSSREESTNTMDRTDGESSFSSFCSSFFKTDSGSADDSDGKSKKVINRLWSEDLQGRMSSMPEKSHPAFDAYREMRINKNKDPPWMADVRVTDELIYKYQMKTRTLEEVLEADRQKISKMEQPNLVNEQLSQLYFDLQLEGLPAHVALEEGITSSGSSGEDNKSLLKTSKKIVSKGKRKKREHSRLVMIYEEDAPLPPPDSGPLAPILTSHVTTADEARTPIPIAS